jgi:hypothetical protein
MTGSSIADLDEPLLASWLSYVASREWKDFAPVEPFDTQLGGILWESRASIEHVLQRAANPYYQPDAVAMVHAALPEGIDLLLYNVSCGPLRTTIHESANFIIVHAAFGEPETADRRTYIARLIEAVICIHTSNHDWRIALPAEFGEPDGAWHVTNEGAPPVRELFSRHDRVDIIVLDREPVFVFYKKIEQLMTFRKSDAWLSSEARAAVRAWKPTDQT